MFLKMLSCFQFFINNVLARDISFQFGFKQKNFLFPKVTVLFSFKKYYFNIFSFFLPFFFGLEFLNMVKPFFFFSSKDFSIFLLRKGDLVAIGFTLRKFYAYYLLEKIYFIILPKIKPFFIFKFNKKQSIFSFFFSNINIFYEFNKENFIFQNIGKIKQNIFNFYVHIHLNSYKKLNYYQKTLFYRSLHFPIIILL